MLYPNPADPLNGAAAALMFKEPEAYKQRIREHVKKHAMNDFKLAKDEDEEEEEEKPAAAATAAAAAKKATAAAAAEAAADQEQEANEEEEEEEEEVMSSEDEAANMSDLDDEAEAEAVQA